MDDLKDQRRHNFTIIDNPAMDDMSLNPSEFTVYCHLARMADNTTKECFPAISTLSKRTSVSERQVRRAIKRLIELGMLSKTARDGKSSIYTLTDVSEWHTEKVTNVTTDKSTRGINVTPTPDKSTTRTILSNTNTKDIAEASAPPKPRQRNPHFDAITTELDRRNKSAIPSQIGKLVKLMKSLDVAPDDIPQYFEWLDTHKRGIMVEGKMWSWSARNINAYVTDWLDSRTDAQTEDKFDFDNPLWVTH